jgi:hypothetical protein
MFGTSGDQRRDGGQRRYHYEPARTQPISTPFAPYGQRLSSSAPLSLYVKCASVSGASDQKVSLSFVPPGKVLDGEDYLQGMSIERLFPRRDGLRILHQRESPNLRLISMRQGASGVRIWLLQIRVPRA